MRSPIVITDEELQKVEEHFDRYRAIAKEEAPDGTKCVISPEARDFCVAFALRELATELIDARDRARDPGEIASLRDRALRAQKKACAIWRLPIYRFELACMYDAAGELSRGVQTFRDFLVQQASYQPDPGDSFVLDRVPYSVQDAIDMAIARSV